MRNAARGTTTLVSRASKNADGTIGDPGLASSTQPSISGDGLYVVFTTKSSNISPDDADGTADVYVRNTATGITYLVSRATNAAGGAAGNGDSTEPVISTDGGTSPSRARPRTSSRTTPTARATCSCAICAATRRTS